MGLCFTPPRVLYSWAAIVARATPPRNISRLDYHELSGMRAEGIVSVASKGLERISSTGESVDASKAIK